MRFKHGIRETLSDFNLCASIQNNKFPFQFYSKKILKTKNVFVCGIFSFFRFFSEM